MMCEKCGANPATVHTKITINGVTTEKMLCSACFAKENEQNPMTFSFNDFLSSFINAPAPPQPVVCSACGTDIRQFKKTGLLGCPQCYKSFASALESSLKRIHGKVVHEGKRPNQMTPVWGADKEIDDLKAQLAQAVAAEEYEKAAQLRDRIKKLESEEAKG